MPTSGSIYGWAQRWRSTPTAVFHRRKSPGRDANTDIARALRRRLFASVTLGPIDSRYSETLAALFHSLLPYEPLVKHALSSRSHVQTTIFARCCSTRRLTKLPSFGILPFFILARTPGTISERCVEALCDRRSSAFRDRSTREDLCTVNIVSVNGNCFEIAGYRLARNHVNLEKVDSDREKRETTEKEEEKDTRGTIVYHREDRKRVPYQSRPSILINRRGCYRPIYSTETTESRDTSGSDRPINDSRRLYSLCSRRRLEATHLNYKLYKESARYPCRKHANQRPTTPNYSDSTNFNLLALPKRTYQSRRKAIIVRPCRRTVVSSSSKKLKRPSFSNSLSCPFLECIE